MRHLTFRVPLYLYNQIVAFAEPKAMGLSEALRFIIENYLKEVGESTNVIKLIRTLDKKIDRLAAFSSDETKTRDIIEELHQLRVDSENIKRALVILGGASARTKAPLRKLFPEHGGKEVIMGVRPEHFELADEEAAALHLNVDHVELLGADTLVHGHFSENKTLLTIRLTDIQHFKKNTVLPLTVPPQKIHLFDKETGNRIGK